MSYLDKGWVVCPDNGPHRVVRMQPASFFPAKDIVSWWEKDTNILHVNQELYASLEKYYQHATLRTREDYVYAAAREVFNTNR